MARELDDPVCETLADGLLVAPQPRRLAPAALFGESIVEGREALGTRDGDQEVPPDEADQSLDLALVVALARPAEPVLEQIVGLKLREDARSLVAPINPICRRNPSIPGLCRIASPTCARPFELSLPWSVRLSSAARRCILRTLPCDSSLPP